MCSRKKSSHIRQQIGAEIDFGLEQEHRWTDIIRILDEYVKFYNEMRPCIAIGYDTPEPVRGDERSRCPCQGHLWNTIVTREQQLEKDLADLKAGHSDPGVLVSITFFTFDLENVRKDKEKLVEAFGEEELR